jgi:hypothetical protein
MDEDSEKRAIEDLPVVSSVRFHAGDKTHKSGVYANLRCGCGVKQVGPIRKSSERPTNVDCFRELGRVIQRADEGAASRNANDVLMLRAQLKRHDRLYVLVHTVCMY